MRFPLFAALLFSSACLAAGADSQEFVGVTSDGKLTVIKFLSKPEEWTGNNWIYGSSRSQKSRYCWTNEVPVEPSDPYSARQSTHFVCTAARGAKPTVFYKHARYDWHRKTGLRYQEAMSQFSKVKRMRYKGDNSSLVEYFVCDRGCDATTPVFMFEVAF